MRTREILTPLFIGVIGVAVGAAAVVRLDPAHGGSFAPAVAYAGSEDDQQRIVEAVKHVEPSVVALDVSINGTPVLTDFDLYGTGGANTAFSEAFSATANSAGQIVVSFSNGQIDQPSLAGVEVW